MKLLAIPKVAAAAAALSLSLLHAQPAETSAPTQNIAEIVADSKDHSTLAALLNETGLVSAFRSPGQFTLFAPTDMAFAKLGKPALDDLKKPQNRGKLMEILTSHAMPGVMMAADVKPGELTMMSNKKIPVKVEGNKVMVGGATVIATDLTATNGVVHVIDAVIVPK